MDAAVLAPEQVQEHRQPVRRPDKLPQALVAVADVGVAADVVVQVAALL